MICQEFLLHLERGASKSIRMLCEGTSSRLKTLFFIWEEGFSLARCQQRQRCGSLANLLEDWGESVKPVSSEAGTQGGLPFKVGSDPFLCVRNSKLSCIGEWCVWKENAFLSLFRAPARNNLLRPFCRAKSGSIQETVVENGMYGVLCACL